MNGENRQRRNAFALAISAAAHLTFLGMVVNTSSIPYDLPVPPPPPEPPAPAMEVEIVRFPPPAPPKTTPTSEPTPAPPLAWPHPERMRVLPPLPPTPTPTPTQTPEAAPAPAAPPLAAPTPPAPVAVAPRKLTLAERKLIQAAEAARAAPVARPAPLGALNIHVPALAPPAGVPTLPMAGTPGSKLAGGAAAKGGGGAAGGGAAGQRGVGLSPFPYGYMPSGGSGLRGTLVGCANAEAIRLSAAERDKCNERFGVEIGAAPKLDPIAGSRGALDRAAAREAREQKYRDSTTDMNHAPSAPGGIAAGPASTMGFPHDSDDPK